jgi:hypothetical protein
MMNSTELKAFPAKLVTGGETTGEKVEVFGAKAKGSVTTIGGFIGAFFMAPLNGLISFTTDICALGADVCDCVKGGKGGD